MSASIDLVVVIQAGGPESMTRECVRRVLASRSVRPKVILEGPPVVASPFAEHPRLQVVKVEPADGTEVTAAHNLDCQTGAVYASGFRLDLPSCAGLSRTSLIRLLHGAQRHHVGLVNILLPGATDISQMLRLWQAPVRQAAQGQRQPGESLADAVGRLAGLRWEAATTFDIRHLGRPASPADPISKRIGRYLRDWLPGSAYQWIAPRAKEVRRRLRNYYS